MYVREQVRGQGVADAIVTRLSLEAVRAGLPILRLETGTLQTAAIRFYGRLGFGLCGPFEPYSSMPTSNVATSVFMEKRI